MAMAMPAAPPLTAAAGRSPASRVAVVGAGLAGLTCARALVARGFAVAVFDKGRSVGGRLAVRRVAPHTFDLGAQYFTARDPRFAREVEAWLADGACQPWDARIVAIAADGSRRPAEPTARFVGTPDMNAIAHHVGRGLDVRASHRVDRITRDDSHGASRLVLAGTTAAGSTLPPATRGTGADADGAFGTFDHVVLCMPPSQAENLVAELAPDLAAKLCDVPAFEPCFALGLVPSFSDYALAALGVDAAFVGRPDDPGSILSWIARDSSKPARPAGERWVLHASTAWTRAWFDRSEADVTAAMLAALARVLQVPRLSPPLTVLRRWTLARAASPLALGPVSGLHATAVPLSGGGDWAAGGRIESAYLSGLALADEVVSTRSSTRA